MKKVIITCDACEKDLSENNRGFTETRLVITEETISKTSNFSYAVPFYPQLGKSLHFCNQTCLTTYFARTKKEI